MPKKRKVANTVEIRVDSAKNVREMNIAGQAIRKNAPEQYHVPSPKMASKISVKNLDGIDQANIAGVEIVDYREKDFKTALSTLENVIAKSTLAGEQKKEFREIARQIKQAKPGVDSDIIRSAWGRIVHIVNLAGLASGMAEKLLGNAWKLVSGYLGLG